MTDSDSAKLSDINKFGRFFHAMLERGIYLPPSQFEALFRLRRAHRCRYRPHHRSRPRELCNRIVIISCQREEFMHETIIEARKLEKFYGEPGDNVIQVIAPTDISRLRRRDPRRAGAFRFRANPPCSGC